jgi:signal peptidase I
MRRRTVVLLSLSGVLGALLVAGALIRFVGRDAGSYRVPSESMVPTFEVGDVVTLNRAAYDDAAPEIGDIVIHHPPMGAELGSECGGGPPPVEQMCARPTPERSGVQFIKRVVAGPGERVALRDGIVVRDGEPADEPYIADCGGGEACDFPRPITIPDRHYLLLGDNRGASDDSRFWGPVPAAWILGRVEDCDLLQIGCSPIR